MSEMYLLKPAFRLPDLKTRTHCHADQGSTAIPAFPEGDIPSGNGNH
jgi:hypothetical protein